MLKTVFKCLVNSSKVMSIILFTHSAFAQKKIISLSLASDEILDAIQPECPQSFEIVALSLLADDETMSFVSFALKQKVKIRSDSSVEQWVHLKADHIFASSFNRKETLEKLAHFKISHSVLRPVINLASIVANIREIGEKTNCKMGSESVIARMRKSQIAVKRKNISTTGILYVGKNMVIGKGTVPNEIFELAGGKNLAADAKLFDWPTVSGEWLLQIKPRFILVFDDRIYSEVRKSTFYRPGQTELKMISGKALFSASHHVIEALPILAALF